MNSIRWKRGLLLLLILLLSGMNSSYNALEHQILNDDAQNRRFMKTNLSFRSKSLKFNCIKIFK